MLSRTFSSLKHRNYRLFFCGQLVSLIGVWIHWTAQQWLVYLLTDSKAFLGIIAACQTLPMLFFSIMGGMVADRLSKRKILLCTQWVLMFTALVMGLLVVFDLIRVWHIALLATISGVAAAFEMPARQSFMFELVGREDLMNAIGLNSSIFNTARIIGPAIAGIVMAELNIGHCFFINGISFLAAIFALFLIRLEVKESPRIRSVWDEVREGFSYVYRSKEIFWLFVTVSMLGIFGLSHIILVPAFARDILLVGGKKYGFLMAASGIGALLAALTVATLGKTPHRKVIIVCGVLIFFISASIFCFSRNYFLSCVALMFSAYGITTFFTTSNTFIQMSVSDDLRGRVMGIWAFVFGGAMPIGSLQVGFLGEHLGPPWAIFIGAVICFLMILLLSIRFFKRKTT